jgi:hypothetical protein
VPSTYRQPSSLQAVGAPSSAFAVLVTLSFICCVCWCHHVGAQGAVVSASGGCPFLCFCCVGHSLIHMLCLLVSSCRRPRCRRLCKRWVPLPLLFPVLVTLSFICCVCWCHHVGAQGAVVSASGGCPFLCFCCVGHSLIHMLCLLVSSCRRPRCSRLCKRWVPLPLLFPVLVTLSLICCVWCHRVGAQGGSSDQRMPLSDIMPQRNLGTVSA